MVPTGYASVIRVLVASGVSRDTFLKGDGECVGGGGDMYGDGAGEICCAVL